MKKVLSLLLSFSLLLSIVTLFASCDFGKESGALVFESRGDGTCYVSGNKEKCVGDIVIPEVSPEGDIVTSIATATFANCTEMTSITIPKSVESVGPYAFSGCSGLESITMVEGNKAYYCINNCLIRIKEGYPRVEVGCKNSVIPEDVTAIDSGAFMGCSGLTSITIPKSVRQINNSAFAGCTGLESVTFMGATQIGIDAFANCPALTDVYYAGSEEGWESMAAGFEPGNEVLKGATVHAKHDSQTGSDSSESEDSNTQQKPNVSEGLAFAAIPLSKNTCTVTGIGKCSDANIVIPELSPEEDKVVKIDPAAFDECEKITGVTMPKSVEVIGSNAFRGCQNLQSLDVGQCEKLTIGSYAFEDCTKLTTIDFSHCQSITISENAFENCPNLTSIIISNAQVDIDRFAFGSNVSLSDVYYTGTSGDWITFRYTWVGVAGRDIFAGATIHYNYVPEE